MTMNRDTQADIETLWQAHRDGELDAAGRDALKAHLADHPHAARVFEAESQWLDMLRDDDPTMSVDAAAFKRNVIDTWSTPETVGFIGRYGSAFVAAASIALIAGLMWFAGQANMNQPSGPVAGDPGTAEIQPATADRRDGVTSPVSRFVLSVSGAVDRQPAAFRRNLDNAAAAFGVDDLMTIFPNPDAPEPSAGNDETRS